jgi:hypothetical protein
VRALVEHDEVFDREDQVVIKQRPVAKHLNHIAPSHAGQRLTPVQQDATECVTVYGYQLNDTAPAERTSASNAAQDSHGSKALEGGRNHIQCRVGIVARIIDRVGHRVSRKRQHHQITHAHHLRHETLDHALRPTMRSE